MDAGHGRRRPTGIVKYADMGNMTKEEIDKTIAFLIEAKKAGQFRALWKEFNESVNLMASGEVGDPVDVVAGRDQGPRRRASPATTSRSRKAIAPGPPASASRPTSRARSWTPAYEFINWFLVRLGRRLPQPPGLLHRPCSTTAKAEDGALRVGLLDGRQARREGHRQPDRRGARQGRRDPRRRLASTSAWARVACWNTVMDEDKYMVRKWNEFVAA